MSSGVPFIIRENKNIPVFVNFDSFFYKKKKKIHKMTGVIYAGYELYENVYCTIRQYLIDCPAIFSGSLSDLQKHIGKCRCIHYEIIDDGKYDSLYYKIVKIKRWRYW